MKVSIVKKLSGIVAAFALVAATLFVPVAPVSAQGPACDPNNQTAKSGVDCAYGTGTPTTLFGGSDSIFTTIVNVLLFIIGAISVIMLIWGGIRYTTSAGNSASVTAAKNTIMYAIIGLVIAFLAFALVNWVIGDVLSV